MTTLTEHHRAFRRVRFAFTILLPLAVSVIAACGQTAPKPAATAHTTSTKQAFEVAAVRVFDPNSKVDHNDPRDASNHPQTFPSNRLTMHYVQMISLICDAYSEIDCRNVVGGPPWLRTNEMHYDLSAKVEGNAMLTKEQMKPMLRTLLEERFHLKIHVEQRTVPGYALAIAKGGSKLRPNKGAPFLGIAGGFELKFQNVPAEYVGKWIGDEVKKPVVDKTGLTGMYDFDLKFRPATGPFVDDPRFANLPDIFTAVQEQLGLKLVPEKVRGDYLVIEQVDKIPTEN